MIGGWFLLNRKKRPGLFLNRADYLYMVIGALLCWAGATQAFRDFGCLHPYGDLTGSLGIFGIGLALFVYIDDKAQL